MTTGVLDDLVAGILEMPAAARAEVIRDARKATADMVWVPNPGPQTDAYLSLADELYYGGQAGGGKSDLGIGLAITRHTQSLILRRFNADAKALAERTMEIIGSRDGYNGQDLRLRLPGRQIDYDGCKDESDKQRHKGDPHDLIVFDEIPDFLESQYTFIIGWNRSANKRQRCRVVCTGNPPTEPEGLWVIKRWAAWLDPTHPHPAKEGELRWYTTGEDGKEIEVDGRGPHMIKGEPVIARSRTFIRARLSDNPDLAATDYDATLAALPDDYREAYREGKFDAGLKDKPRQLIPTSWVRAAMERWTAEPPIGIPMCAIAADCSGGGKDPLAIQWRHDGWFSEYVTVPAKELPKEKIGRLTAAHIITHRRDRATIILDMGGGYGSAAYEHLVSNVDNNDPHQPFQRVMPHKGSEGTTLRSHDHQYAFKNKRTAVLWRVREALDPEQAGGSPIMLPPDSEMLADLTAPTYKIVGNIIEAESKEIVCARLGRSTDKGDTTCMCWSAGPTATTDGNLWQEQRNEMRPMSRRPSVIRGRPGSRR